MLSFAFLPILVPVAAATTAPTSPDAFRMGPSLWSLFAARAQLQPSIHRSVWHWLLPLLVYGLAQYCALELKSGDVKHRLAPSYTH